jgi:endonuclease/exonuclease/phosphatase family metal-dependent hydrolase
MPAPLALLGDMNFRPDGAEYARIVGPLSPRPRSRGTPSPP